MNPKIKLKKCHDLNEFSIEQQNLISGFKEYLSKRKYCKESTNFYMITVKHYLKWLSKSRKFNGVIDERTSEIFLFSHLKDCKCQLFEYKNFKGQRAGINQFLKFKGFNPLKKNKIKKSSSDIELIIREFDLYLQGICGLSQNTRIYHRRNIRFFLNDLFKPGACNVSSITSKNIVQFVMNRAEFLKTGSIGPLTYSLRIFLKYLRFTGHEKFNQSSLIPRPPNYSLASLPPSLNDKEIEKFWTSFDHSTIIGKRDYAIARCIADLGLRCSELVRMNLDDIDWRRGILNLQHTKSNKKEKLPLLKKTGQALLNYIRYGRVETIDRAIFVYHRAPVGERLQITTIRNAIRRAFSRAGLPEYGPHIFRHTLATRLFQSGASLKETADVMRHTCIDTTRIYTKIDFPNLNRVVMPWPGELS